MGYEVQTGSSTTPLRFLLIASADHITGLTGASPTVTLAKITGGFVAPMGAVSEIANGWYQVAGNATDTNTIGPLLLHATASSADPTDEQYDITAFNPSTSTNPPSVVIAPPPPTPNSVTALSLITLAFNTLGIFAADEAIPQAAAQAAFTRLLQMCTGWSLQRQLSPVVGREVWPVTVGQGGPVDPALPGSGPYTIGPTGDFVTTRPFALEGAGILLGGTVPAAEPLGAVSVLTDTQYQGIVIKNLPNSLWTAVYYRPQTVPATGNGELYLWPVPNSLTNTLVIYRLDPIGAFASLTTSYVLPEGYPEAIHYNLAVRLCAPYGLAVPADVGALASFSLATIKRANTRITDAANDLGWLGTPSPLYNILLGNG